MMKSYTAYCMNEDGVNMCMTREYNSKKDFINDLHGNGYKVHFVALTDKYDEESTKYHERLEKKRRIAAINRKCDREYKELQKRVHDEVMAELAAEQAEEPTAEEATTAEETEEEPAADQEPETIKPFDELTEEELDAIIAEEVEKEYFGEPAADQAEEETTENYVAWCGMIESDVITEEYETLSEAIDEVETRYTKEEMKAAEITFCKLLCNAGQWLECLEEKTVDDVYYF